MNEMNFENERLLLIGSGKLACSLYVCLCNAGSSISFFTENTAIAKERISVHFTDMNMHRENSITCCDLESLHALKNGPGYDIVLVVTDEDLEQKRAFIKKAEQVVSPNAIIAINTESIALSAIQQSALHPARIIGANWSEPAHTTYFLEIISNEVNSVKLVQKFNDCSKSLWHKDPYILKNDFGIRSRMLSAMIREAFYLVENGYVTIKDIDRACRNDAGYYLPFAGNFRYMDLMGTYLYGMVMKDLNPELSNSRTTPSFFKEIVQQGGKGIENHQGFHHYKECEPEQWDELSRNFSYEIMALFRKYPFAYHVEDEVNELILHNE
ncbi:MAG: 3-hydroxyacyl-CoA dehydrogenase NAD-binding domain-containing protein [Chitinophagaceae bacterium]